MKKVLFVEITVITLFFIFQLIGFDFFKEYNTIIFLAILALNALLSLRNKGIRFENPEIKNLNYVIVFFAFVSALVEKVI